MLRFPAKNPGNDGNQSMGGRTFILPVLTKRVVMAHRQLFSFGPAPACVGYDVRYALETGWAMSFGGPFIISPKTADTW